MVHWIPEGAWVEPTVLVALGVGLLLAGGRQTASAAGVRDLRVGAGVAPPERAAQ